jgi:hypothetical protein
MATVDNHPIIKKYLAIKERKKAKERSFIGCQEHELNHTLYFFFHFEVYKKRKMKQKMI